MNKHLQTLLIIAVVALVVCGVGIAIASYVLNIPTNGNIATPASLSANPVSIATGTIVQGNSKSTIVTLTNNGQTVSEPLTMATSGTLPAGVTVGWDVPSGTTIAAGASLPVTLTVYTSASSPAGPFNFNVVVNG